MGGFMLVTPTNTLKSAFTLPSLGSILLAIAGFAVVFVVGASAALLPPLFLVAFFSLPVALLMAAAFPAGALFLALVVTFGLMPPFVFASLPLGKATVRPHELILFLTFALVFLKGLNDWRQILPSTRPLWTAFSTLGFALAIGLIQGKLFSNNPSALAEFRQFFGWLALPIALWLTWRNENTVHRIIMSIALIASAGMFFQLLTGIQVIYGFRGAEELSKEFQDVKRSAIGGGVVFLCYAGYYLFFRICDAARGRLLSFLGLLLILGGLIATFTRGIWLGFFLGGILFLALTPRFLIGKSKVISLVAVACLTAGLAITVYVPRVSDALIDRVTRVAGEGARGTSFGYRFSENTQAWLAIQTAPLLGKGLGAQFKAVYNQSGNTTGFSGDEAAFIHNTYLFLWVKLGILGLLYPVALVLGLFLYLRRRSKSDLGNESNSNLRGRSVKKLAAFCCLVTTALYGMSSNEWAVFTTLAPLSCLIALIIAKERCNPFCSAKQLAT